MESALLLAATFKVDVASKNHLVVSVSCGIAGVISRARYKMPRPPVEQTNDKPVASDASPAERTFAGGGEMGSLIRSKDWTETPFGPVETWPQSLRTAISIMLSSSFAMVVAWGPDFRFFYNDRYRPVLGAKHPSALGTAAKVIFPEAWDFIGPLFARTRQGEAVALDDVLIPLERHGYLENCYFVLSYSPIRDESGEVGGMLAVVSETTERVQSERRLKSLRDLARQASDTSTVEAALAGSGRILSENDIDVPFALFYKLIENGKRARLQSVTGLPSGIDATPEVIDLFDDSEKQWPLGEAVRSGQLTVLNDLGTRFGPLPGGPYPEPTNTAVIAPLRRPGQQHADGAVVFGVSPRRALDDQYRGFYELAADHIQTAIGNSVARQEERERLQKLVELDRAKTLFFSNVSHEFRTPLTLMLGPLQDLLVNSESKLQSDEHEQLAIVHRNGIRLLRLVNTLLDFSRIEAGRVQAAYEPTDLCELTENLASGFRSAMEKATLEFQVDCQPIPEAVYVDHDMWEKIVLNLLSNAFKFTLGGRVAVALKPVGDTVELAVSDTGTGIASDELQRVFERFHRIEGAQARTHEGTGIGLALVQELVKLHGGSVRVESTLGKGSTFIVTLQRGRAHLPADWIGGTRTLASPAVGAEAFVEEALSWLPDTGLKSNTPARTDLPSSLRTSQVDRPYVLVADDNADMRQYLTKLLSEHYEIQTVPNGEAALAAIGERSPDLILSDVMMPKLDGFGLVQKLRSNPETNTLPIILLSARAGEEARVEGMEHGADDYLIKPFSSGELLACVAAHVKLANTRREAARHDTELRSQAELERRRLQELLAQAPALIGLLSGPEHRWTYVNDLHIRITGRKGSEDFLGKTIRESLPELEGQGFFELLDEVYRTGQAFIGREMKTKLNRSATGQPEEAYFNFVYQPITTVGGLMDGILIHAVEITDQVTARKAIEKSEERLRLAQTAAQIGTWEWDPIHITPTLSPELHRLFATEADDPEHARVWASRVHPEDQQKMQTMMEAGYQAGSMDFEYRYLHPSKGMRWFYCKGRRVREDSGMIGVLLDVTERKKIDEDRFRLAAIVESSDDAIVSKDLNGFVTSWNLAAEKIFGYTAEEMVGQSIIKIIPPELQEDERRILDTVFRGESIDHFETVRITKDGHQIDVSLTVSPIMDQSGKVIGAAKIARDITERKKTEQALRTTERLASVGRLAATVAHEINNPLEAVTNFIYLAKQGDVSSDVREYLAGAEEELERVAQLTKQTLGFYRDTRGASSTSVGSLMTPLLSVFSSRARNKAIEIRPEIRQHPEIIAVPGEIRQLLSNLLGNSIDAVDGKGGLIRIRVSGAQSWCGTGRGIRLTVADSGSGIEPAIRSKLFEPFFTTKKEVGTGLGLWVCKSIVEKHGGTIRVKSSVKPGRSWTIFSVFLPIDPPMEPGRAQTL
jgi:PAS domain S-box-containing protein